MRYATSRLVERSGSVHSLERRFTPAGDGLMNDTDQGPRDGDDVPIRAYDLRVGNRVLRTMQSSHCGPHSILSSDVQMGHPLLRVSVRRKP